MPRLIKTISEFHEIRELPKPQHPLFSVINFEDMKTNSNTPTSVVNRFYSIAIKRIANGRIKYGQQEYDFNEGIMFFIAPGQVYSISAREDFQHEGWVILIHPDFLWNTPLANTVKKYDFFSYSVNEALFLSEKEENIIKGVIQNMYQEYQGNIDKFSQDVIIAHLELLFTYGERFYHRQFITRKVTNHTMLDRLEAVLTNYFKEGNKGLPTVQYVSEALNVSPNYLSGLLKVLTGQSTQQHIHDKVIEVAKEKLSTTQLSVSEIAYELGFEHPQSFSKLFKTKTNLSPVEFRQSFN
jgi:AraC-like DNA-binding protein